MCGFIFALLIILLAFGPIGLLIVIAILLAMLVIGQGVKFKL